MRKSSFIHPIEQQWVIRQCFAVQIGIDNGFFNAGLNRHSAGSPLRLAGYER